LKAAGKIKEKSPTCSVNSSSIDSKRKPAGCINTLVEMLKEGQECPFCHFAKMKRDGGEIICSICGYGHRAST
jgi:hypothetical protein